MSKIKDRMARCIKGSVAAKRLRGMSKDAEQERAANGRFGSGGSGTAKPSHNAKPAQPDTSKHAKYEGQNEEGFAVYSNYHN